MPPPEFWCGVAGGLGIELLKIYNLRHLPKEQRPLWLYSGFYWLITAAMVFAGGGLVMLYIASGMPVAAFIAFNIGASAPLILEKGFQAIEKPKLSDQDARE